MNNKLKSFGYYDASCDLYSSVITDTGKLLDFICSWQGNNYIRHNENIDYDVDSYGQYKLDLAGEI